MSGVLLIFDDSLEIEKFNSCLVSEFSGADEIILCPFTTDELLIKQVKELINNSNIKCNELSFIRTINQRALELRSEYIEEVAKLSRLKVCSKSLVEHFCYPSDSHSSWWFGRVAEKNPLKSRAFQLYVVVLSLDVEIKKYSCSRIVAALGDIGLLNAIKNKSMANGTGFLSIHAAQKQGEDGHLSDVWRLFIILAAWWRRVRREMDERHKRFCSLRRCAHIFVTYFPLVDKAVYKNGKYLNKYLGPLQKEVDKKYKDANATIAIGIDADGYSKFDGIGIARNLNRAGAQIIFLNEATTIGDLLSSFVYYCYMALKYLWLRRSLRKALLKEGNEWLWNIWNWELDGTFFGGDLVEPFLAYKAFKRLFSHIEQACTISYIAEMHAWETALNAAGRNFSNIKTVGIQHTQVPLLLLNYFESPSVLTWGRGRNDLPLPEKLGCVGPVTESVLNAMGWPREKTFQLGALRKATSIECKNAYECGTTMPGRAITVSLPYSKDEMKEILKMVYGAVSDVNDLTIYLKFHPISPPSHLDDPVLMKIILNPPFIIAEETNEELMRGSFAMIVGGSSSCLAALEAGRRVIVPLVSSALCLNPLFGLSDLPSYVANSQELRDAVLEAMRQTLEPEEIEEGKKFSRSYYAVHNDESEYLRRLEMSLYEN